ncbi:DgyrCDS8247 [Dimorphilus gyrociliatus]|uniref:DgyrCDS8247 n=1 Tax=Dimorphilus gyrociliatus TaxID=2664684 RepID=A0A7I8VV66_9ANNE|nr:DgyrCDS8247 [Dimorphilus gyrociliatus]
MKNNLRLFLVQAFLVYGIQCIGWDEKNALDEYVWKDDGYYKYEILDSFRSVTNESTIYVLNMTSQKWLDDSVSDSSVWWHYMGIAIPDVVDLTDAALVYNDAGRNDPNSSPPDRDDLVNLAISVIAEEIGIVVSYVKQIPNQPIVFKSDPEQKRKTEDRLIGYTWRMFIDNPESPGPEVLARFPMTKAVIKAFETTRTVAAEMRPELNIQRYAITGASKRGWTAWMVACVDKRAIFTIPMVMDLLNLLPNMKHHYRALGGWTFAFKPYYEHNLTVELDNPNTKKLASFVDPYEYKERLNETVKFIISGASDEFFLTDDSHYFFHDLPGPKYMMLLENAGHAMFPHYLDILEAVGAIIKPVFTGQKLPQLDFEYKETEMNGTIIMRSDTPLDAAYVLISKTVDNVRRDWRLHKGEPPSASDIEWDDYEIQANPDGSYSYTVEKDPEGKWTAFFLRAEFTGENDWDYIITSEAHIVPDVFPFPECFGQGCRGELL